MTSTDAVIAAALQALANLEEELEGLQHDLTRLANRENHYVNQSAQLEKALQRITTLSDSEHPQREAKRALKSILGDRP